jgi:hypothetical protein
MTRIQHFYNASPLQQIRVKDYQHLSCVLTLMLYPVGHFPFPLAVESEATFIILKISFSFVLVQLTEIFYKTLIRAISHLLQQETSCFQILYGLCYPVGYLRTSERKKFLPDMQAFT